MEGQSPKFIQVYNIVKKNVINTSHAPKHKGMDLHHLIATLNNEASLIDKNGTTTNIKLIGILSTRPPKSLAHIYKNVGSKSIAQHISKECLLMSDYSRAKYFIDITNSKNYMPTDKDQQTALINLKMIRDILLSLENTERILNRYMNENIPKSFIDLLIAKRNSLVISKLQLETAKDPHITGTIKYIKAGQEVPQKIVLGISFANYNKYTSKFI
jgi:hypothetical protein